MRTKPTVLQIGAVTLAVALTGTYVWFRSAQAGEGAARVFAGSKSRRIDATAEQPAAAANGPTTAPALLPGSKSFAVFLAPTTAPTTSPARRPLHLIYSSKSAPVDLKGVIPLAERPATAPSSK